MSCGIEPHPCSHTLRACESQESGCGFGKTAWEASVTLTRHHHGRTGQNWRYRVVRTRARTLRRAGSARFSRGRSDLQLRLTVRYVLSFGNGFERIFIDAQADGLDTRLNVRPRMMPAYDGTVSVWRFMGSCAILAAWQSARSARAILTNWRSSS